MTSSFTSDDPEIQQLFTEISERVGRLNDRIGRDSRLLFALVAAPNPYRETEGARP